MGDVCEDEFGKLCSKYLLKRNFRDKHIKINLNYLKPRSTISNIIENSKFKNSVIVYLYKIIDMSQFTKEQLENAFLSHYQAAFVESQLSNFDLSSTIFVDLNNL